MSKSNVLFLTLIHFAIISLILLSPFLISWYIIAIGIIFYYLQLYLFNDCILTKIQFNTKVREMTMYSYLLELIGFKFRRKKVRFFADFILPYIILFTGFVLQVFLDFKPIIHL